MQDSGNTYDRFLRGMIFLLFGWRSQKSSRGVEFFFRWQGQDVEYFLGLLGADENRPRIAQRAMHCLLSYNWPGNVRELQNVLERGMILSEQNLITEKALPLDLVVTLDQGSSDQPFQTLQEIEREHILKVLDYVNGHRTKAAKILGVGRKTLYRKIQELNLGP